MLWRRLQKKQVKIVKTTSLLGPNFITSFWAQVQEAFTCLISRLAAAGGHVLEVRGCIHGEVPVTEEKPLQCGAVWQYTLIKTNVITQAATHT